MAGSGIIIPMKVPELVQNIYISPDAQPILEEVVSGLAKSYGLTAAVNKSDVNDAPLY